MVMTTQKKSLIRMMNMVEEPIISENMHQMMRSTMKKLWLGLMTVARANIFERATISKAVW